MVMKNSEYRNTYQPKFEEHSTAYAQNLDFRSARRSREFQHNTDAFVWERQDWEKGSQSSVVEEPRPGTVPSHKYKHKLFNKLFQEKQLRESLQAHCVVSSKVNGEVVAKPSEEGPPSPPPSPETEIPSLAAQIKDSPEPSAVLVKSKTSATKRPSKPQHRAVVSKKVAIRPKSCVSGPKKSSVSPRDAVSVRKSGGTPTEDRPPFVMYGSRDHEQHVGQLKTHNIRAPVDVYPSALRAQKYRESEKQKRLKSAPATGRRKPLSFDEIMDKQTSNWQTEYKGHFVGYEKKDYQRSVFSRLGLRPIYD